MRTIEIAALVIALGIAVGQIVVYKKSDIIHQSLIKKIDLYENGENYVATIK